ncbi:hypothetical protein K435DRAFT_247287 [Dendrothele bispora CBS 962.96]|uniref:Nucleolar GTP-binding protein 1 Rossman-fold domain-containing protein n=1 Tax=Dendrothele bispora (strain CBS 962.96) TaxID=1314807 RepID=A0A4S8LNH5_DENBC|nr:hypothetical protein K435DRAFT_247287 [Dendrothele bispora CBS 962.96]
MLWMQSITALAHLKSRVLYFMDLSEQCEYTIKAQVSLPFFFRFLSPLSFLSLLVFLLRFHCKLFHSIKLLFTSKLTLLVLNKSVITTYPSFPPPPNLSSPTSPPIRPETTP